MLRNPENLIIHVDDSSDNDLDNTRKVSDSFLYPSIDQYEKNLTHQLPLPDDCLDANNPPIVIVGAGMGGPFTALKMKKRGFKVLVITKYPYSVRSNRITIHTTKYKKIFDLINGFSIWKNNEDNKDKRFFEKLKLPKTESSEYTWINPSLKSIEKFYKRKMLEHHIPILYADVENSGEIDTKNYTISIELEGKKLVIPFRHIVDASGSARVVFKKLAKEGEQVVKSLGTSLHDTHASITFVWENADPSAYAGLAHHSRKINLLDHPKEIDRKNNLAKELKELGWEKPSLPEGYISTNYKGNKWYLVGEIPPSYFDFPEYERRQKIIIWYKTIMNIHYKISPEELTVLNKNHKLEIYTQRFQNKKMAKKVIKASNKLAVNTFTFKMQQLVDPILDLDKKKTGNRVVFAEGDAVKDPIFHFGHGTTDAHYNGFVASNCLNVDGTFDIEHYRDHLDLMEYLHESRVEKYSYRSPFSQRVQQFFTKHRVASFIIGGFLLGIGGLAGVFTAGLAPAIVATLVITLTLMTSSTVYAGIVATKDGALDDKENDRNLSRLAAHHSRQLSSSVRYIDKKLRSNNNSNNNTNISSSSSEDEAPIGIKSSKKYKNRPSQLRYSVPHLVSKQSRLPRKKLYSVLRNTM